MLRHWGVFMAIFCGAFAGLGSACAALASTAAPAAALVTAAQISAPPATPAAFASASSGSASLGSTSRLISAGSPLGFFRGAFELASQSFATSEQALRSRLGFSWRSGIFATEFRGFHEAGPSGDQSIDFPQAYGGAGEPSEFWFGRRLPWITARDGQVGALAWTSARSQAWVQNQSDVFEPLAVGWVGAGLLHSFAPATTLSVAYSPVFLPHFGPSVRLSQENAAEASRYGRLPPQQVRIGEAVFPIRYRIDAGDLAKILLQQQAYVELKRGEFSLLGWSAPNPEPEVDPSAELLVRDEASRVLVTARPRFERQNFAGLLWNSRVARAEALYEFRTRSPIVSFSVAPLEGLEAGVLHRWRFSPAGTVGVDSGVEGAAPATEAGSNATGNKMGESPAAESRVATSSSATDASRGAVFVRWKRGAGRVRPWMEWRGHAAVQGSGVTLLDGSIRSGLEADLIRTAPAAAIAGQGAKFSPSLGVFASAQLLGARDESPWAAWRSLDYVQVGVVSRW